MFLHIYLGSCRAYQPTHCEIRQPSEFCLGGGSLGQKTWDPMCHSLLSLCQVEAHLYNIAPHLSGEPTAYKLCFCEGLPFSFFLANRSR